MSRPNLTLHCFAGDPQSLAVIYFADYLNVNLSIRYLKPINLNEKIYKSSLTKSFPMLQVDLPSEPVFIERSNNILKYLSSLEHGKCYSHSNDIYKQSIVDQILDTLSTEILPSVFSSFGGNLGIVELEKEEHSRIKKDIFSNLHSFSLTIKKFENFELSLFDFQIIALVLMLNTDFSINKKIPAYAALIERLAKVSEKDHKFCKFTKAHKLTK